MSSETVRAFFSRFELSRFISVSSSVLFPFQWKSTTVFYQFPTPFPNRFFSVSGVPFFPVSSSPLALARPHRFFSISITFPAPVQTSPPNSPHRGPRMVLAGAVSSCRFLSVSAPPRRRFFRFRASFHFRFQPSKSKTWKRKRHALTVSEDN